MTSNSICAIEARQLCKTYAGEDRHAVHDVSLEIQRGEFLAIVGPSGSGKSTLLHLLSTLDCPDSGRVSILGQEVSAISDMARFRAHHVGFVFQLHFLLPDLTLAENAALALEAIGGIPRRERRRKAVEALESVGLSHRLDSFPTKVSGGERQRAAIARAIVNRPSLLFADEPTGNVDSASEASVLDLFDEIRHQHDMTFVVVTHNPLVSQRADRVLTMTDGKLRQDTV